ncbi:MAG: metallophosphoesterase [Ignavibacteriae bacterium]|nr:metallophosphoesterase [Ignavibacteriota bacterium]
MKNFLVIILNLLFTISIFSQEINFFENFNDGSIEKWTIVDDEPSFSGPSNWFVDDKVLRQTSNIWAYAAPLEFHYHLGTHLFIGDINWADYSFNVNVKAGDDDGIGILFRYNDEKNYYRFLLIKDANNGGPKWKIQKFVNGEVFTLYEEELENAIPKNWFALTANVRKDSISIYVNSKLFRTVQDSTYSKGKIGLTCYAMSNANFDSISVTSKFKVYDEPENTEIVSDRKPFIQLTDTNSVAIAWNTKNKSIGKVEFGIDSLNLASITEDTLANRHFVLIENLETNQKYFYKVYNNNDLFTEQSYFKTAENSDENNIDFLIWGDSGTGNEAQYKIAEKINSETDSVDFGIHVGDVSQSIGQEYDNIFFTPYAKFVSRKNVYTCIGNHDTYYDNAETYLNDFYYTKDFSVTERYYTVKRGQTFFLIIDSNIDFSPQSNQYKYIDAVFKSEDYKSSLWKFVVFHHPPYCELWPEWDGDGNVRNYLLPLFEKYNVDIVFNGHTHGYERGLLNGVYYIITGGGGGGLDTYARDWAHIKKSISIHHYCKVNIKNNVLTLTAIDTDGEIIDKIQILKTLTNYKSSQNNLLQRFELQQNYPNPFNNSTTIVYSLSEKSNVKLKILNEIGEQVEMLELGDKDAGIYKINYTNNKLVSGIYFVNLITDVGFETKKMILIK